MVRSRSPIRAMDHPRSRGVYGATCISIVTHLGSSPLARGLPIGARLFRK